MTRLGLSVTVLSLLFSGAVLAAPATSMTQTSDANTKAHMEKKADQHEKKPGKATPKHSHNNTMTKKTQKTH
ncbi:hypothetical protein [Photorhabdus heterorhabditis]|uniref:Pentapeptide MXKDX repeat protein n=1 Tax=Photorhabdus heterorhabditis TaxID=880156 RepID=A0A5B0W3I6_9GAMM|nr:hypothetical protein [Photorhabdus heterorhabditis]KAA1181158.1 hypothetical protein F0L16_17515 [Photorhabdus heterorhabditis]KOY61920.1 hypothetical protein AM629_11270 [Photorhabdus heterorhabditis]MBS9443525.1 hypothetical protein [Photorhabdus heterorhabditis]